MPEKTYSYADVFSDGRGVLSEPFSFKPGSPDFEIRGRRLEGETAVFLNEICLSIDGERSVKLELDWGPTKNDEFETVEWHKYLNLATGILKHALNETPYTIDKDFVELQLPPAFLTAPGFLVEILSGPLADTLQLLKKDGFVLTKNDLQTWICAHLLDEDNWDEEGAEDCKHVALRCYSEGLVPTPLSKSCLATIIFLIVFIVVLFLWLVGYI